MDRKSVITKI